MAPQTPSCVSSHPEDPATEATPAHLIEVDDLPLPPFVPWTTDAAEAEAEAAAEADAEAEDRRVQDLVATYFATHWPDLADGWKKMPRTTPLLAFLETDERRAHVWRNDTYCIEAERARRAQFVEAVCRTRRQTWGALYGLVAWFLPRPDLRWEAEEARPVSPWHCGYSSQVMKWELDQYLADQQCRYRVAYCFAQPATGIWVVVMPNAQWRR